MQSAVDIGRTGKAGASTMVAGSNPLGKHRRESSNLSTSFGFKEVQRSAAVFAQNLDRKS